MQRLPKFSQDGLDCIFLYSLERYKGFKFAGDLIKVANKPISTLGASTKIRFLRFLEFPTPSHGRRVMATIYNE